MKRIDLSFSLNRVWFLLLVIGITVPAGAQSGEDSAIGFPAERPKNGNENRPVPGEVLDVTPPGFCWWRAGERGQVRYRVRILDEKGTAVVVSDLLEDPAFVPAKELPAGKYSWTVEAIVGRDSVCDVRPASTFTVSDSAKSLPWIAPEALLGRVPSPHPRLLFPREQLPKVRATLKTVRASAFADLQRIADEGLSLPPMAAPDFDKYGRKEFAALRTAYRDAYRNFQRLYNDHVVPMALMYLMTGEKRYGEAAKTHLLNLLSWPLEGVTSVQDPRFDEVGLNIAHTAPQTYDWCYDLLTSKERKDVEDMLVARGNLLLSRMQRRDFLNASGESHDGRVPGYLIEFSVALADRPEAKAWLDYGMKAMLTVFPHWGDADGGWAEGVDYALTYNDRFITPIQSLATATGYNLWNKSFFRKFPYFLISCLSPRGEISPFGDMEHLTIDSRADKLCSILQFSANCYQDPTIQWWVDLFDAEKKKANDGQTAVHRMILADTVKPIPPTTVAQDRAFTGIGWAVMHTDLSKPSDDLLLLFKCSPFGQDSHSHADQNSFAITEGGDALALPSGARYPQQGSPFHTKYTIQTVAHNAILVNGNGQITKDESATGRLLDFRSLPHIAYAAGDAQKCYGDPLTKYVRHVVLVRPSLILIVDDVAASEPVQIDWLMHGKERFEFTGGAQRFVSRRKDKSMTVDFLTPSGVDIRQDNAWPVDPKEGYPMVTEDPPTQQWHLDAVVRNKRSTVRLAAVMAVGKAGDRPDVNFTKNESGKTEVAAHFSGGASAAISLDLAGSGDGAIIDIRYTPEKGKEERLTIPAQKNVMQDGK